jgi:NADH:ubiquinone oxidoreductase subunit K
MKKNFFTMNLSLILFTIGILGFVLNRKNIILMLISIEIMLLAITFLVLVSSLSFDDILGQTYAIYIIAIAGAESAIGLGILVAFYRLIHSLNKNTKLNYSYSHFNLFPLYSNIIQRRNYTTDRRITLNPLFVTGFSDAESSFVVTILKNPRYKIGWNVQARFQIKLHEKDRALLILIQNYFQGIGYISKINSKSTVEFRVSDITSLKNIILSHFERYPLLTNKYKDFIIFKQIVLLMSDNKHTNLEGLKEILEQTASLNWGLSKNLKESFPLVGVKRITVDNNILNDICSEWLAGFSSGESNFYIAISGNKVWLRFSVAQDSRDLFLLNSIVRFFNCGYVSQYKNREVCEFVVTKINDIIIHIIPFFDEYKINGTKYNNYLKFKEATVLIKNKEHLTEKGLNKIIDLKKSMNMKD